MRKQKHSEDFKALEAHWYQKLKESGFEDIEDVDHPERALKSWHSFRFGRRANHSQKSCDPDSLFAAQEYYRRVGLYLEETYRDCQLDLFSRERLEVRILELHGQGMGVRKIGQAVGMHYLQVHKFIQAVKPKIKAVQ